MSDQLRIADCASSVTLTARQQAVLTAIEQAGKAGLEPGGLGALLHGRNGKHGVDGWCPWCRPDGRAVALELKRKGLVVERARPTRWVAAGEPTEAAPSSPGASGDAFNRDGIPFRPAAW